MWLKNASVIKKLNISNPSAVQSDPDVKEFIDQTSAALGKKGRFVVKLSGIPNENSVLVEGKRKKLCNQKLEEFMRLLVQKGYMRCQHVYEAIQDEDYGETTYRSDGGGVAHFIVTLYGCRICHDLKKEYQGDFTGDPSEYLEITRSDELEAEIYWERNK